MSFDVCGLQVPGRSTDRGNVASLFWALLGWRPSLLGWRALLLGSLLMLFFVAGRLEAVVSSPAATCSSEVTILDWDDT